MLTRYIEWAMLHRIQSSRVPFRLVVWYVLRDYLLVHRWDLGRAFRRASTRKRWR